MKIALAHYSSPTDISGVTTWFEHFVLRLKREGHEPIVHLHHFGDDPSKASIIPKLQAADIKIHPVRRGQSLQDDVKKTLQYLSDTSPDIFLPQCLSAHYIAGKIAGQQGLPWAFTVHSDDPDYWDQLHETFPVNHCGVTVCVSELITNKVCLLGLDSEPRIIPYGVSVPDKTAVWQTSFRIVYSGRLVERQKRISLVVQALIQVCQANPNVIATILGDGPEKATCEAAVAMAGLKDRITFEGRLPPDQVGRELLNSHAILLMSDFEGLPVALLEAMSAGVVPVVRLIDSGIPELVKHEFTGLLVDDSPTTASDAIIRLTKDRSLWQTCSDNARELVNQKYSDTYNFDRWMRLIDELGQRSSPTWPLKIPEKIEINSTRLAQGYLTARPLWRRVASRVRREIKSRCDMVG